MSNSSTPGTPNPSPSDSRVEQQIWGDRNQSIGQVLGGIVVYVSGGQAVFHSASTELASSASKSTPSDIGPNPYKGLMAFQETDGDRFFGREKQIAALWEKLRSLHEAESTIRVLPIYGPSGSGKSSLARAGLIPELARQPIPGYDRARVAVLVPGTYPLESLATVLARIVTQDLIPVAKTREFAGELKQVNEIGEYDGLRRIADVMPDIAIAPLVVLVDQFEEVYTLCKDNAEREAFVGNLLNAASDRAKRVTVIVTLRSDFLGETQKHPFLNQLFTEQGYLVPAMSEAELREAIRKPAEKAGHPLDEATIDLLVKDTEGREGALPLLQFALTRIWEGLAAGRQPTETLKEMGGVGGALAGEAQRIYETLRQEEQEVSRRVFLGLVQLGEGTKDTRRRASINNLVSYREQPKQVKRVIDRFAEPGVRLITLSAQGDAETAEVTHEALFDHWQLLNQWLDQSRDDLRFRHRLEEATQYWQQNNCPEGNLWRSPDLDLLTQYQKRAGKDMTSLQMEFFIASQEAQAKRRREAEQQQRFQKRAIQGLVALSLSAFGFLGVALGLWTQSEYQRNQAEISEIKALTASSKALFTSGKQFDALLAAVKAGMHLKRNQSALANQDLQNDVYTALQQAIYDVQEQNRLEGHGNSVYSVSFSPDDQTIASASWDRAIRLWNRQGKLLKILNGHKDDVMDVSFSPNGKILASTSRDKTIKLWNIEGINLTTFTGHSDGVLGIAFSPDSKIVASSSYDKTIKLWKVDGNLIRTLTGNTDSIWSLSFSPDGEILASAGRDGKIKLWRVTDGKLLKTLAKHEVHVRSISFSKDGKKLISASDDGTVKLWSVEGNVLKDIKVADSWVMSANLSPDGKTLVTGDVNGFIKLWSVEGELIKTLIGNEAINKVTFSHDGKTIASAGSDKVVRLWSTNVLFLNSFSSKADPLFDVAFSPDSKQVVASSYEGKIIFWNMNGTSTNTLTSHKDRILSIAFSPTDNILASGSWDGTINLWSKKGKLLKTLSSSDKWLTTGAPIPAPINKVKFSPEGKVLASVGYSRKLRFWNLDGTPLKVIDNIVSGGPELSAVYGLDFNPNGGMLATAGWDKEVKLWSMDGKLLKTFTGHTDRLFALSFSPDGKTIASAGLDRTIMLWSIDGHLLETLVGHTDTILGVTFSPDGRMLASASNDKTVRLWKSDGTLLRILTGHTKGVISAAFSSDGKTLATASLDGTVKLWDSEVLDFNQLLTRSCNWLQPYLETNMNISVEEYKQCN